MLTFQTFPKDLAGRQAYADDVAQKAATIDQQTFGWMNRYKTTVDSHLREPSVRLTLKKAGYVSTQFFWLTQYSPIGTVALSACILLRGLQASNWRRSLLVIGPLVAGILFALQGRKHDQELGALSQVTRSLEIMNRAIDQRATVVKQREEELWAALNDQQLPPEQFQETLIAIVNEMDGQSSPFINKFIVKLQEKGERTLSDPNSFMNTNRYLALHTIYDTLGCNLLLNKLTDTKSVYADFDLWVDSGMDKKGKLFERMMEYPSRFEYLLNQILEEMWLSPWMRLYDYRLKNTQMLMPYPTLFEVELDRRRKSVFELSSRLPDIGISFDYVVQMLYLLKPVSPVGCMIQLAHMKERFIKTLSDKEQRSQYTTEQLIEKGLLLGFDRGKLEELLKSSFLNFLKTFKRQETRIGEFSSQAIVQIRGQLRDNGNATAISKVPSSRAIKKLTLAAAAFQVIPRPIEDTKEEVNLLELIDHLHRADQLGLIPDPLVENVSKDTNKARDKKTVLNDLGVFLNKINDPRGLNQRLSEVRRILRLYTVQFRQKVAVDLTLEQQREIYGELVSLVATEIGFAIYHCEDRQLNAAMMVYREKIKSEGFKETSIPQQVQQWAAKQRDTLVSQIIYEMVLEASDANGVEYDAASRIGYWRYILRNELALGNVPPPAYNLDETNRVLDIDSIRAQFKKTYTAQWLFAKAQEEHNLEEAQRKINANVSHAPELSSNTIYQYLSSVISNFDEVAHKLFDEEKYTLLDRGLALYLQETGLIER